MGLDPIPIPAVVRSLIWLVTWRRLRLISFDATTRDRVRLSNEKVAVSSVEVELDAGPCKVVGLAASGKFFKWQRPSLGENRFHSAMIRGLNATLLDERRTFFS